MSVLTISMTLPKPLDELDDRERLDVLMQVADRWLNLPSRIREGGMELKVTNSKFDFCRINLNHRPAPSLT